MADYVDTKVSNLVINNLTQEKYDELLASGQINPDELYCTPDSRASAVLFEAKWFDHIVDDMSWLRADNFTWHSGDVYKSAYEHLYNEVLGREGVSETIAGITVWFVQADDGHKVCPASEEANVQALYEATGVAWYYILDQANKQFKLPRTKFGFTGLRDSVGGYVPAGLPNITGTIGSGYGTASSIPWVSHAGTGALYAIQASSSSWLQGGSASTQSGLSKYGFDASRSNTTYGNSDTVQPRATQMYLYFYVGNFTKSAVEQTAGITSEQLNAKADKAEIETQLASKADDSNVVHKTGNEAVGGDKIFTSSVRAAYNSTDAFQGFLRGQADHMTICTIDAGAGGAWNNYKIQLYKNHVTFGGASTLSMPTGYYTSLTLGSSGSSYTAPADGWFVISKVTNDYQYISMLSGKIRVSGATGHNDFYNYLFLPVRKGDKVSVHYTASGTTEFFRFVYAEGSKYLVA